MIQKLLVKSFLCSVILGQKQILGLGMGAEREVGTCMPLLGLESIKTNATCINSPGHMNNFNIVFQSGKSFT